MRFYAFNNMYIQGIHNGIQADHAKDEIWLEALKSPEQLKVMKDFAQNHKTTIILIGGDHTSLWTMFMGLFLRSPHPFGGFKEPGLNNALTSIGIVVPERLYDKISDAVGHAVNRAMQNGSTAWKEWYANPADVVEPTYHAAVERNYTNWELEFLAYRVTCPLAK